MRVMDYYKGPNIYGTLITGFATRGQFEVFKDVIGKIFMIDFGEDNNRMYILIPAISVQALLMCLSAKYEEWRDLVLIPDYNGEE